MRSNGREQEMEEEGMDRRRPEATPPETDLADRAGVDDTRGSALGTAGDPGGTFDQRGGNDAVAAVPSGDAMPQTGTPLGDTSGMAAQWSDIQTRFVDEPRRSVEEADALVADVMQQVTSSLTAERQRLEAQWERGENVTTEDLRIVLTRYRSFFDRLLAV